MGFKFRKSIKIAPGVKMNVGKRGVGVSVGGKGLRYSVNTSGRRTTTVGVPGSGLSYSSTNSSRNYKTNAYQKRKELEKREKEIQKMQELERAKLEVEVYENKLERLRSIHHECDDYVNWIEISQRQAPFNLGESGPNERQAINMLTGYKPNVLQKLFKQEDKKRNELENEVYKAREKDGELFEEWQATKRVANQILNGDIDTYFQVIEEFDPLGDLVEFGSGFEFGLNDSHNLYVEFEVNGKNVVPNESKSLLKSGKVSQKAMPKSAYFDLYQDYVCSCAIRIARDLFALLPLQNICINAYDEELDSTTGHNKKIAILSVKYDRATFDALNFNHIDPSDALANFEHHITFKKTKGFEEITQFVNA